MPRTRTQTQQSQHTPHDEHEDGDGEVIAIPVDDNILRMAHDLVRLALFNEQKRLPLRREDVSKKILANNSRAFPVVFEAAQTILRDTFAFELVELPVRTALDLASFASPPTQNQADDALIEAARATGVRRKTTAHGSKTYILRSTLSAHVIHLAAQVHTDLLDLEIAATEADDLEDSEYPVPTGAILPWNVSDSPALLAILHVTLALILVSGRIIADADLRAHLRRLRLSATSPLPLPATHSTRTITLDDYLSLLLRTHHLIRSAPTANSARNSKRVRATDDPESVKWEWRWGPRAIREIGEDMLAHWIAEFMVNGDDDEDDESSGDEDEGNRRSRRKKLQHGGRAEKMKRVLAGVERAAGGTLVDTIAS